MLEYEGLLHSNKNSPLSPIFSVPSSHENIINTYIIRRYE
jgi:hypothetical protein